MKNTSPASTRGRCACRRTPSAPFRDVWATAGPRGFYVGLTINYIKVAPTVGLSFMTYEAVKTALGL